MDFEFIPVSKDSSAWQCCILKCGGLKVLLNCGWTETLDTKLLSPLLPHLSTLDLVLITHADMKHMGGLPFVLSKFEDVVCPVVCTEPVNRIGELVSVACLEDREKYQAPSDEFDVDDVLRIFMSRLTPLKFHESFTVQGKNARSLAVCPYPCGGQLGGSYWTLHVRQQSIDLGSAVYMVDFDLRHGRYLDGFELNQLIPSRQGAAQHWDLVITSLPPAINSKVSSHGAQNPPALGMSAPSKALTVARGVAELHLLEESIASLRRGGTVLIPIDVVGEVPELLLLFEAAWSQDRQLATNYPLVWLSSVGDMVLDQLKTRLEFMSKDILTALETRFGQNPFVLKHFKIFPSLEELISTHPLQRPKVILATSPHLEGGDSRELFMRLCSDPGNLVWIFGLPPKETLARQLLEDFVLRHSTRKDYRLKQYSKQALPDEHLKAYYEAKVDELAESGLKYPMVPEDAPGMDTTASKIKVKQEMFDFEDKMDEKKDDKPKLEKMDEMKAKPRETKSEKPTLKEVKEELKASQQPKSSMREDERLTSKLLAKEAARAAQGVLWSPYGWPSSRTMSHWEGRREGDEYGHILMPAELKAWRSQDQEGNKYSFGFIELDKGVAPDQVKEEVVKVAGKLEEDVLSSKLEVPEAEWKEQMRLHFHEPMHCEVRDRMVRVACRIRSLPWTGQNPKDIYTLLQAIAPKRIVLLPTAGEATFETGLLRHFRYSQIHDGMAPEIHSLDVAKPSPKFAVQGTKRRFQFEAATWKKLSFMKVSGGVRLARVRVTPSFGSAPGGMTELKGCEAPTGMLALGDGSESNVTNAMDGAISAADHLPRTGALFLGLGRQHEAMNLSGLKDHLLNSESATGEVAFRAPKSTAKSTWSSRVLVAEGRAVIGWVPSTNTTSGTDDTGGQTNKGKARHMMRVEGVPGEPFFRARAVLYKKCLLI
jgi:Cft2 family RNA processing exonuclease